MKEGTPLADIATISGSTSNMLTILNVQVADAGEYWVVVRDTQEQKVTSEPAQLKVNAPPPQITQQPTNQTVTVGQTAVFVVQAQGTGLGYQWVKEGTPLANSASISGADTNRLVIQNVQVSDAGEYWVVVTDEKC
ncbi:MAG: immunoglobulin domain-containing protein [Verrucomicrobiota bacterium]